MRASLPFTRVKRREMGDGARVAALAGVLMAAAIMTDLPTVAGNPPVTTM